MSERSPLLPEGGFTTAWLKSLMAEKRVLKGGHWKEFSSEALQHLVSDISSRAFCHLHPPQSAPELQSLHDEDGIEAAQVLLASLSARRNTLRRLLAINEFRQHDPCNVALALKNSEAIALLEAAIEAVDNVMPLLSAQERPVVQLRWQDHACSLAECFMRWRRIIQPELPVGLSIDGPVATFVASVMPFITGDKPSVSAAGTFLKRNMEAYGRGTHS